MLTVMKLRRSTYYSSTRRRARGSRFRLGVIVVGSRRDRFRRRRNAALLALVLVCVGLVLLALTQRGSAAPGDENTESAVKQMTPNLSETDDNVVVPTQPVPKTRASTSELRSPFDKPAEAAPSPDTQAIPNLLHFKVTLPKGSPSGGEIYCGLFDEAGWPWQPLAFDIREANGSEVTCEFRKFKPGTYAIAAFFDRNGNHDLDRNWLGMPTEPWVLSRGVRPGLPVPPAFSEVSFHFDGGIQVIDAELPG